MVPRTLLGWQAQFLTGLAAWVIAQPQAAHAVEFASTAADQTFYVGTAVSVTLPALAADNACNATNVTWTISPSLPAGLSFDAGTAPGFGDATRVLSGTPQAVMQETEYTYSGFDQGCYQTATTTFKITVLAAQPLTLSTSRVNLTEGGATGTYTVKLPTAPTGNVTVAVVSGETAAVTVSPSSLTFTTTNYSTAQTVTLTPESDADGANASVTITHSASGGGYDNKSATLTAAVTDDDRDLVLSSPPLSMTEGSNRNYTVALAAKPAGNVTIPLTTTGGNLVTLTPSTLTFTDTNWSTAQTVAVTAPSDTNDLNDVLDIIHTPSGGDYEDTTTRIKVIVYDSSNPEISLSPSSLTLNEGGATGTVSVTLTHSPNNDVTITTESSDTSALRNL